MLLARVLSPLILHSDLIHLSFKLGVAKVELFKAIHVFLNVTPILA